MNWIGGTSTTPELMRPNGEGGNSAFGDDEGSFTSLFDLTTSYQANSFLVGLNAAYGSYKSGYDAPLPGYSWSDDATWWGIAGYANVAFSDVFALGGRLERFNDPDGVRYFGPLEVTALTITGDFKLADGRFNIKPEIRFDKSEDGLF